MLDLLQVHDPLADKPVTITIRLQADNPRRDERTALVVVGVEGEAPIFQSGPFQQLDELIGEAWRRFGVREPIAASQPTPMTEDPSREASSTIIEVAVEADEPAEVATATERRAPGTTGAATPKPTPPKTSILDLF